MRLGVRYSDGTKATTIEAHRRRTLPSDDPPAGPLLSWSPGSSDDTRRGDEEISFSHFGLAGVSQNDKPMPGR